jgi:mevalonate kinase
VNKVNPSFFAKILLFGEYGIIRDAMALSIPFKEYRGSFRFISEGAAATETEAVDSQNALKAFAAHLRELSERCEALAVLDLDRLDADLELGLYFDSSIPQGFGVGSSGALVAALYARYAVNPSPVDHTLNKDRLVALKAELAQMESFFHGRSSGIDPTICYLQLPLLIRSADDLGTVALPEENALGKGAVFLINSGAPGETQPLVTHFMEKLKEEGFRKVMKDQFKKYNDACIQAFLQGDPGSLFRNLKPLSRLVMEHFDPMIPSGYHDLWQKGIDSNAYYLKLCGSGGGGYILGFAPDFEAAAPLLDSHDPEVIFRF